MDRTSAAEANLDARVRPQIVALRTKTPYPKRRTEGVAALTAGGGGSRPALSLVGAAPAGRTAVSPLMASRPVASRPVAGARTPIKLTRRGRVVVGMLIGLLVAAMAFLIWFAVAGQAQASSQVGPAGPANAGVSRVVVRPGETLWGIAAKADPDADPRATIDEIIDLNSLRGTAVQVGQVLLIPKS
jgi:nucleoid-associated protein YgaU